MTNKKKSSTPQNSASQSCSTRGKRDCGLLHTSHKTILNRFVRQSALRSLALNSEPYMAALSKVDCLIENANENYEIDVQHWTEIAKKLFDNLMTHEEVKLNSCLVDQEFDDVFFDITFTDAAATHELNRNYREKDYPADIITFALFADSEDDLIIERKIVLGDIIIALDKVEEMAKEQGKTFEWELKFLIAHGILHLLGFDHQTEDEYNFVVSHQVEAIEQL